MIGCHSIAAFHICERLLIEYTPAPTAQAAPEARASQVVNPLPGRVTRFIGFVTGGYFQWSTARKYRLNPSSDDSSDSNSESTLYHSKTSSIRTPTTPHIVERPRRQRQEVDYNPAGSNRLSMQRSDQQLNVKVLQNCHSQRPQYQQDHELDDVKEQPQVPNHSTPLMPIRRTIIWTSNTRTFLSPLGGHLDTGCKVVATIKTVSAISALSLRIQPSPHPIHLLSALLIAPTIIQDNPGP